MLKRKNYPCRETLKSMKFVSKWLANEFKNIGKN